MSKEQLKPCPYSDVLITCPKESVPMVKEFIHAMTSNPVEDALRKRVEELEKITLILTDALEAFVETGDLRKSQCDGFISLAKETKKGGGE